MTKALLITGLPGNLMALTFKVTVIPLPFSQVPSGLGVGDSLRCFFLAFNARVLNVWEESEESAC